MDFGYTETQQMVRSQLREFVTDRIVGENFGWDDVDFPHDVYDEMADLGLLGLHVPEAAGGEGFDPVTSGVVYEVLGRGDVGLAMLALSENLVNKLLWEYGDETHRDVVRKVVAGEEHTCFALTEPGQGSDAQNLETTAEPTDDGWLLSGEKTAITGATLADHCFVVARQSDPEGIRAFLVPLDADGVDVQPYAGMGCEVSGWGQIFLDDVAVPAEARVADQDAFKMAMRTFDQSRAWIALYALGAAQQTLDETESYLTEREAMGKPLAAYEGPQFEFAECQTRVDAARLKCYQTLWKAREGEPHTKDAAMVKWYGPEVAVDTVRTCLVLHGHYGYSDDFGIGKRLQDVLGQQIADGTPHVQKIVVARETFGREYLPYDR
jgi:cyclohexanecarboxyl-CoA dehydrogenase